MVPEIVHEGIITAVDAVRGRVQVALADAGAESCASCAAAMLCKRKGDVLTLTVAHLDERFKPGERVRVGVDASSHRRAVGLLLALPALMLVVPLLALAALGLPGWVAVVVGFGCCALTYGALWLRRHRLNSADVFQILAD